MIYEKMNQSNTALVVIDIVNDCAHKKCETPEWKIFYSKIRKMIPHLNDFISKYREAVGGLIIFVNITPWKKKYLPDNLNELYTDPKACYYSEDDSGFPEKFYLVSPKKEDFVVTKNNYDAFASKEFRDLLKQKKIRYLVVTGIFGDGCVLATICGGFSRGYNFVILKDLIETTDVPDRQEIQKLLKKFIWPFMYGRTITSKTFLKSWKKQLNRF